MKSAARFIVSSLGVLIGVVGILNHGFFEILQGNKPATGLIIKSVGEGNFMGAPAGEEAFTLIPNYLFSGIATILVCLVIIVWSVSFIHRKYGSIIFLLLCILQSLVGGGLAQILIVLIIWIASTRVDKPFRWMRKVLSGKVWRSLANLWLPLLIIGIVLVFLATQIALFQVFPGVNEAEKAILISLCMLVLGIVTFVLTILAGFAHDIQKQTILYEAKN